MQIEKLTTTPSPLPFGIPHLHDLLRGYKAHHSHAKALRDHDEAAEALLPDAVEWIHAEHGIIVQRSTCRLAFEKPSKKDHLIHVPLSPLAEVLSCRHADGSAASHAIHRSRKLLSVMSPLECSSTIHLDAVFGWRDESIPHLVKLAMGLIAQHWASCPADRGVALGNARAYVQHYLMLFSPGKPEHYLPGRHVQVSGLNAVAGSIGVGK